MNKCNQCQISFKPKPGSSGKFCGRVCFDASNTRRETQERVRNSFRYKYSLNPKHCQRCSVDIPYKQRMNRFCSHTCAAVVNNTGRVVSEETKQLKSIIAKNRVAVNYTPAKTIQKKMKPIIFVGDFTKVYCNTCAKTGQIFFGKSWRKYHPDVYADKEHYYRNCQFRFALADYPEYFDLSLIKKHGMYSTPGSRSGKKNVDGVSRDHLISVSYGYENDIDPKIIAHPANCRLVLHKENNSKNNKCSITLEELLTRIDAFG